MKKRSIIASILIAVFVVTLLPWTSVPAHAERDPNAAREVRMVNLADPAGEPYVLNKDNPTADGAAFDYDKGILTLTRGVGNTLPKLVQFSDEWSQDGNNYAAIYVTGGYIVIDVKCGTESSPALFSGTIPGSEGDGCLIYGLYNANYNITFLNSGNTDSHARFETDPGLSKARVATGIRSNNGILAIQGQSGSKINVIAKGGKGEFSNGVVAKKVTIDGNFASLKAESSENTNVVATSAGLHVTSGVDMAGGYLEAIAGDGQNSIGINVTTGSVNLKAGYVEGTDGKLRRSFPTLIAKSGNAYNISAGVRVYDRITSVDRCTVTCTSGSSTLNQSYGVWKGQDKYTCSIVSKPLGGLYYYYDPATQRSNWEIISSHEEDAGGKYGLNDDLYDHLKGLNNSLKKFGYDFGSTVDLSTLLVGTDFYDVPEDIVDKYDIFVLPADECEEYGENGDLYPERRLPFELPTETLINGDKTYNLCFRSKNRPPEPGQYTVTVDNGTGDGNYEKDAEVTITADAPAEGEVFDIWTSEDGVTFADPNSATTTFTMLAKNVTVKANFRNANTVATPTFSPAAGTYDSAQNVTISCATDGAEIYYTTDGTAPTKAGNKYSTAIPVKETSTIKAIAVKDGMTDSAVAEAEYTISASQAQAKFKVTVTGGTGSGEYAEGAKVSIKAGDPADGKVFDKWTTSDGVTFADAASASTTFTMPAKPVTVTAVYKDKPHEHKMIHHPAVAATRTSKGNIEYWECEGCKKLFSDAEGKNEISPAETVLDILPDPLITPAPSVPVAKETTINGKAVKIEAEVTYPQAVVWTGGDITKEQLGVLTDDGKAAKVTITGLADAISKLKPGTDPMKLYKISYKIDGKEIGKASFIIQITLNKKALKKAKITGPDKKALVELVEKLNKELENDVHWFDIAPINLDDKNVSVVIKAKLKKGKAQADETDSTIKGLKSVTITYKVPAGKDSKGRDKFKKKKHTYKKSKVNGMFVIKVTDPAKKKASITATDTNVKFSGTRTDITVKK